MKTSNSKTTTFYSILFFLLFTQISWGQFGGNPCAAFPCENGGECVPIGDAYECVCIPGSGGSKCDTAEPGANIAPSAPIVYKNDVNVALSDDIKGTGFKFTFTITGGTLTLGTSGIIFGGGGNGSTSFWAEASQSVINTALDNATFTPTLDLIGTDVATISFYSQNIGSTGVYSDPSATVSVTFSILDSTLSLEDNIFENNLKLYPNPLTTILNIKNTSNNVISTIKIIDVFGKTLHVSNYNNLKPLISLNISSLSSGIYFAKISTEHYISTRKIIIN
jgi:hypothetical protein